MLSPLPIYFLKASNIHKFDLCDFTLNRSIAFLIKQNKTKQNDKNNIFQPVYVGHMFLISNYKNYLNVNITHYASPYTSPLKATYWLK